MNSAEGIKKLSEMIKGIKFAMMTTHDDEGSLYSRPMMTQNLDSDGALWFLTSIATAKTHQIQKNQKVNIAYSDPSSDRYISVTGRAEIIQDQNKIKQLWSPMYKAWFPKGVEDPTIGAICVHVERAEYWDSPSSTMAHLYGLVKSTLTGSPAHPGENAKLDIAS